MTPTIASPTTSKVALALSTVGLLLVGGAVGYVLPRTGFGWGFVWGVVAACGLGWAWGWNGLFNLGVTRARPHGIAAATGMTQGGVPLGGSRGQLLFAAVSDRAGYGRAWYMVAGAAAARRPRPSRSPMPDNVG